MPPSISLRRLALSAALVLAGALPAAADLPADLSTACRDRIPSEFAPADPSGLAGENDAGRWFVAVGEMDGAAPAEAVLVLLPAGRSGEVRFLARKADGGIQDKRLKLKAGALTSASVSFAPFGQDRALAHLDGGSAGQRLLHWNGDKLETVWEIGKTPAEEHHWFEIEDLDGDGTGEVICYTRRSLDIFLDEDDLDGGTGGMGRETVDVVAVQRYEDGRWKKSRDLLEGLR